MLERYMKISINKPIIPITIISYVVKSVLLGNKVSECFCVNLLALCLKKTVVFKTINSSPILVNLQKMLTDCCRARTVPHRHGPRLPATADRSLYLCATSSTKLSFPVVGNSA